METLPHELQVKILTYVGWPYPQSLKLDLLHCTTTMEIMRTLYSDCRREVLYNYLQSKRIIHTFAHASQFRRIHLIYNSPKNYVISYVQEYPSFMFYEIKTLLNLSGSVIK